MPGKMQCFLAEWRGHDRVGAAAARRGHRRDYGAIGEFAGLRGGPSESRGRTAVADLDQFNIGIALQIRQRHGLGCRIENPRRSRD